MRYSLTKYYLSIAIPSSLASEFGTDSITIGGTGSYLSQISISLNKNLWETQGDSTGSWIHNQNLDRTGTASVQLNQLSKNIAKFKTLCNIYYDATKDYDGLTLTITDADSNKIATCDDCYISKIPNQEFGDTATTQTWEFTCGRITIF